MRGLKGEDQQEIILKAPLSWRGKSLEMRGNARESELKTLASAKCVWGDFEGRHKKGKRRKEEGELKGPVGVSEDKNPHKSYHLDI